MSKFKPQLGYVPSDTIHLMKCNWLECEAGCGISGHGGCFRKGHWWLKKCPEFKLEINNGRK